MKALLILFLAIQLLGADDNDWKFERINFYFENDSVANTDREYTDGSRLSTLLYRPDAKQEWLNIPFTEEFERAHFISFSLTQQMFTPHDLNETELITNDRPYAGWLYFELGLHQSSDSHLDSLSMQVGIIGPASGMEQLQRFIHEKVGSGVAQGWDNQLDNELGVQLNYQHKWRFVPEPLWGIESSVVPYASGEFGNVSITANTGLLLRLGWNVPEDFGSSSIDEGGENGIPVRRRCLYTKLKPWSVNVHLAGGGSYVARDILLDGNTFSSSHSVEKNKLRGYGSLGFSGRYKNINFDYINTYHSPQFKDNDTVHSVGSFIFSYIFAL